MARKGKDFEELVTGIVRQLHPSADVNTNERIRGKSKTLREVDISIRDSHGLSILECKDYGRPVGIKTVDGFFGQLNDIGEAQSYLVAGSGFTKGAKESARLNNIAPVVVIDPAGHHEWQRSFAANTVCSITLIDSLKLSLRGITNACEVTQPPLCLELFDHAYQPLGPIHDVIFDYAQLPYEEVTLLHYPLLKGTVFLKEDTGIFTEVALIATLKVHTESWAGTVSLEKGRGLYNELTKKATLSASESVFAAIDLSNIRHNWQRVHDLTQDAIGSKLFVQFIGMHPMLYEINHDCRRQSA